MGRADQQHGDAPPDRGQALGHDVEGEAEAVDEDVEPQPGAADDRGQDRAAGHVGAGLAGVQPDVGGTLAGAGQQVQHQQDWREGLGDAGQLQGQVEPVVGRLRAHQQGLLVAELLRGQQRADEVEQRVQAAGAQGDREHRDDLPADEAGRREAQGDGRAPRPRPRRGRGPPRWPSQDFSRYPILARTTANRGRRGGRDGIRRNGPVTRTRKFRPGRRAAGAAVTFLLAAARTVRWVRGPRTGQRRPGSNPGGISEQRDKVSYEASGPQSARPGPPRTGQDGDVTRGRRPGGRP